MRASKRAHWARIAMKWKQFTWNCIITHFDYPPLLFHSIEFYPLLVHDNHLNSIYMSNNIYSLEWVTMLPLTLCVYCIVGLILNKTMKDAEFDIRLNTFIAWINFDHFQWFVIIAEDLNVQKLLCIEWWRKAELNFIVET